MNATVTKLTARKFANMVERDLGWRLGLIKTGEAGRYEKTRVRHEVDGTFELVGMPEWTLVKLLELGYTATARVNYKEWSTQSDQIVLYWNK